MFMRILRRPFAVFLLSICLIAPGPAWARQKPADFENNRAMLLGYVLREYLANYHYSHKPFDDKLSKNAFNLYLEGLDFQKKFLLAGDVERLKTYSSQIDDEINKGDLELPQVAAGIMRERIAFVQKELPSLFSSPFDFTKDETIELDPKKVGYCKNEQELRDRWHQNLKFQVGKRFLDLLEDQKLADKPLAQIDPGTKQRLMDQARQKVRKSNEEYLIRLKEDLDKEYYNNFFDAITKAFDPHTLYMPPISKEDFDIHMRGSLEGIGARLREEDGYVKVESVIPGSAAARQGQLQAEDIILKVGEGAKEPVDITNMDLRDAVGLIRGEKGTEVRLTVRKPDGTQMVIPIIRDVVQIEETFVKEARVPAPDGKGTFGYLKIPEFYRDFEASKNSRNVTDDTRKALRELTAKHIDGLILDLRDNSGGSLNDAVMTAGLFIDKGPIVQVREGDGKVQTLSDKDPGTEYDGPMVVLVNRFSASASEIVAGALQDYGRAVIIGGKHTHGKGTVQAVIDLDRGVPFDNMEKFKPLGALKITTQKFYRITGNSTQYRGVVPDIVLPDWFSGMKTGEKYLDNSLPWDTISPVPFAKWPQAVPSLSLLKAHSIERVAHSSDFAKIEQGIQKAKIQRQETRQTLNLEKMQQERQQIEAESKLFSRLHASSDVDDEDTKKDNDPEKWRTGLKGDPYVRESISVLKDISAEERGMVANQISGHPGIARP
ncbi:MAG: carboxy terminal-processing peptidase [Desulfobacteraceae bacterium]|nr:carboxy terminal-processing peptidase [Desulfobacteraceae bacterium]